VSKWHARVTPDECIQCRLCEDACPYGAIDPPTVDQPVETRPAARRRLGLLLALLPVLVIGGGMLGRQLAVPLSRLDPTVALAERVRSENLGLIDGTTDASDAFRNTGRPLADLYAAALAQRHKLALAGMALGAWIGLVVGVKLIHLSIRRRRADYDPNPANCVSCGRCFWYCPQEQARLGLIEVEEKAESGRRKAEERYPIAARTAWVAGVFSVIVSAMLLVDYARRQVKNPLDSPEFLELKAELVEHPRDEALKEEIRAMDLSLREAYYRQRRFAHAGGHLLLLGVLVFLVAARTAATLRRKPPMPEPAAAPLDTEARTHRIARASVVALALVLVAAATALTLSSQSELPDSDEALAEMLEPAPSGASATPPAGEGATPSAPAAVAAAAPVSDLPTDAEIRKYWPRFRGPGGSGVSAYTNLPTAWNGASGEGIVWKTKAPLPGNNSPVVWGDRVFLTGATDRQREVYAFDAKDGKLLWSQPIPGTPQSTAEPPKVMEDTGYAAPTVTTDGRRVYAMFANGDVAALDFGGKIVWTRSLGLPENIYGHAASPVMYKNLVLIQFDQASVKDGKSKLLALEGTTGKTVWEMPREVPNSWATPIVFRHADRDQIVAAAWPWVISYSPADGKELWRARLLSGDHGVSPVFADGLVQIGNEYCKWFALRADGQGDVTKTHVAWKGEDGLPDLVSPLVTGEFLLLSTSTGTVTCYDAKKGGMLWEEDFETDFSSSPSLVGNRVYLFCKDGKGWIIEPTREACKRIAETDLGEPCVTSPALQDGRLYIRGQEHLFCIGK
jgi:outer membrane protein assembly factor BamB/ferredoxin